MFRYVAFLGLLLCLTAPCMAADPPKSASDPAAAGEWHFIVSGDSRNCGDLVMPAIAADAEQFHPAFYWHLGDLRAIYEMDEDYAGELTEDGKQRPWDLQAYTNTAWDDFVRMQIEPFQQRKIPFFVGIGNHETIKPKTREEFIARFSEWLDNPALRDQRQKDAAQAKQGNTDKVQAYYHWIRDGIDFIYLDNSTPEQFDPAQMRWLHARLEEVESNPAIRAVVVGMHKALPNSRSNFHSMSETAAGMQSGRCAYKQLLEVQSRKPVYVLSSHSHFIMTDIYRTPFWHDRGTLPGILVGTAGAVRYRLPEHAPEGHKDAAKCIREKQEFCAQTDVYGYVVATVNANGKPGAIDFQFREIRAENVPPDVQKKFSPDTMKVCFAGNRQLTASVDTTQPLPDGPCPAY